MDELRKRQLHEAYRHGYIDGAYHPKGKSIIEEADRIADAFVERVERQYRYAAYRLGRLIVSTCNQGASAPFIDRCGGSCEDGRTYSGRAILLTPWRRDAYGAPLPQRALVVGWCRPRPTAGATAGEPEMAQGALAAEHTP